MSASLQRRDAGVHVTPDFLRSLRSSVDHACLVTSEKWARVVDGETRHERMSDQARRVALLLSALTFGEGREGLCTQQRHLAAALDMDDRDCSDAIAKMKGWGILLTEQRDDGIWYQLLPSQITLSERAMKAASAFSQLRSLERVQPLLIARSGEERVDGGLGQALAEVDVEEALRGRGGHSAPEARIAGGRFPPDEPPRWEIPTSQVGDSHLRRGSGGRFPPVQETKNAPVRAGIDSYSDRQIDDSRSCRSWTKGGESRFADEEKNHIFEKLEALDSKGELRIEVCRRTWIGRVRDESTVVHRAIDRVREDMQRIKISSPLGRVFRYAQYLAKQAGRSLRALM